MADSKVISVALGPLAAAPAGTIAGTLVLEIRNRRHNDAVPMSSDRAGMLVCLQPLGDLSLPALGRPRHVVAFAASAGGLPALSEILAGLPPDFAAPIVVVQHLDPGHRSWMAEILARRTALSVLQAHGGERLVAGTVCMWRRRGAICWWGGRGG